MVISLNNFIFVFKKSYFFYQFGMVESSKYCSTHEPWPLLMWRKGQTCCRLWTKQGARAAELIQNWSKFQEYPRMNLGCISLAFSPKCTLGVVVEFCMYTGCTFEFMSKRQIFLTQLCLFCTDDLTGRHYLLFCRTRSTWKSSFHLATQWKKHYCVALWEL